ncbi:hypothetical protein PVK06_007765 [Gossypium arboreum]|uniref:Uncharacterized protein n=1 Tax=Gossypium arboreum TaxID=29729 RepID=A0ABR0QI83_GOSAR|nr:hypothetical protein PVK06_007765 [Gossypium arboreum]
MEAYLRAFYLWDAVETSRDVPPLRANPTIAQIKQHSREVAKKYKALSCIHFVVIDVIFTRIMTYEIEKEAWDKLKEKFQGSDRTRQIQVLNLWRESEDLKMKELFGKELSDKRIVEKVLVSVLERFVPKNSSLENSKDISKLTLKKVVNALQALQHRRFIRSKESTEGAFQAKLKDKHGSNNFVKK